MQHAGGEKERERVGLPVVVAAAAVADWKYRFAASRELSARRQHQRIKFCPQTHSLAASQPASRQAPSPPITYTSRPWWRISRRHCRRQTPKRNQFAARRARPRVFAPKCVYAVDEHKLLRAKLIPLKLLDLWPNFQLQLKLLEQKLTKWKVVFCQLSLRFAEFSLLFISIRVILRQLAFKM